MVPSVDQTAADIIGKILTKIAKEFSETEDDSMLFIGHQVYEMTYDYNITNDDLEAGWALRVLGIEEN